MLTRRTVEGISEDMQIICSLEDVTAFRYWVSCTRN